MEPTALPVEPAMVHEAHVGGAGADGVAARSPAAGGDEPPAPQVDADTARVEGGEPAALPTGGLVEPGGAPDGAAASPEACPVAGPGLKGGLPSAPGLLGPSSAEELLERFGHRPGADPIDAAARALRCFSEADSAPAPPSAAGEELSVPLELVRPSGAAARSKLEGGHPEAAQSVSPVPVPCGADLGSIPPQSLVPRAARAPARRRRIPRSVVASAAMLVFGLACVATLWTSRPQIFARRTGPAASATADPCRAPLQLLDLPAPHEVWLLLGKTPLTTPPLPRGVRLELVATAAGHAAQRLVVPPDAPWKSEGRAALLKLVAALEPGGDTAWPPAPPGAVGGSGRAGIIEVTSTPEPAEIWLVVAAGPSGSDAVELGCERAAELLALSPAQPQVRRRFVVGLPELRAAAAAGGAPVSAAR
ncbi:MAG: hypothetical protein HY744_19525 [Deltaproteobacteria bacterium]|nr:hypothetical protein [Deltaproteobacteria bacterium]